MTGGKGFAPLLLVGFEPGETFCNALQIIRDGGAQTWVCKHFRRDAGKIVARQNAGGGAQNARIAFGEGELDGVAVDGPGIEIAAAERRGTVGWAEVDGLDFRELQASGPEHAEQIVMRRGTADIADAFAF